MMKKHKQKIPNPFLSIYNIYKGYRATTIDKPQKYIYIRVCAAYYLINYNKLLTEKSSIPRRMRSPCRPKKTF